MKNKKTLATSRRSLLCLLLAAAFAAAADNPADYVNPNIGTVHSRWFFYTPASVPFGMAKVGPTTNAHYGNEGGWQAVGYDGRHDSIEGFANAHEFQVGGIVLMPTTGSLRTVPGEMDDVESGYRSRFDKADEKASAGSYKVRLKDYGIDAELTATKRVGFHRYTFPAGTQGNVIFDIGNVQGESGRIVDAEVRVTAGNRLEGYVVTYPVYVNKYQNGATVPIYFAAELNRSFEDWGMFIHDKVLPEERFVKGAGCGAYCRFTSGEKPESVEIKVAISYCSIANARENLQVEAAGLDFDNALAANREQWRDELSKITVSGGSREDKVKFYTGLYHALLGRGCAMDVDGSYPRNDGSVGKIPVGEDGEPEFVFCNTDAVWGAYWNLTQLWSLCWPEYYRDLVQTHLQVYRDSGWFGDGLANSRYVSGVGTNFVGLFICAARKAGISDFDMELAYEAVLKNELAYEDRPEGAGKLDMARFVEDGVIPFIKEGTNSTGSRFCASHTMEYCFSAYAAAQWAREAGKTDDYARLMKLSRQWEQIFDDETSLIRPKDAAGRFLDNFDPYEPWRGFQEGNAIQYTYYVPHAVGELVEKVGADEFNERLNAIFDIASRNGFSGGKEVDAFSGLRFVYNHGNQPSLHISWLFNRSGSPWLTQKWTRAICNEFYGTGELHGYGYGQDEDQGQLGAWYNMAALGLFMIDGGVSSEPVFELGSPQFDKALISLPSGRKLEITAENNSPVNPYVQSCKFNGKEWNSCEIPAKTLLEGGKLEFVMGREPNKDWGTAL
ncbi:MAG: GH92 family glycosyl hydrolase [Phycisphaerae bacterium]